MVKANLKEKIEKIDKGEISRRKYPESNLKMDNKIEVDNEIDLKEFCDKNSIGLKINAKKYQKLKEADKLKEILGVLPQFLTLGRKTANLSIDNKKIGIIKDLMPIKQRRKLNADNSATSPKNAEISPPESLQSQKIEEVEDKQIKEKMLEFSKEDTQKQGIWNEEKIKNIQEEKLKEFGLSIELVEKSGLDPKLIEETIKDLKKPLPEVEPILTQLKEEKIETTPEEASYYSLKSDLEGGFAKMVNSFRNKKGFYPEKLTNEIIKNLSPIPTFQKNPKLYLKWAEEQNNKLKKELKISDMSERITTLFESGKLWDYIVIDELDKKHKGDIPSKEVLFLCSLGKLVKNKKSYSFNVLVLDKSSAGKDNLVGSCLKLFPKDDYETYARISSKSLNYLHSLDTEPDYDYNGKILYLKEITEEILNNEVMKEFTSGDEEISKVAITKQKGGGVDIKEVRGHPCVFATTATTLPTEETRNRFNIIKLDLSEEQTARTFIREEGEYNEEIKEFLANLKPYDVEFPQELFNFIVKVFPKNKVRYRRDFPRFLDFIKGVVIFHQNVRRGHTTGTIRAEPEDYNRAKDIFINAFSTCSDIPLKDIDERIIKVLEEKEFQVKTMENKNQLDEKNVSMSAKNILDEIGGIITIANLYPHLRNLTSKEIINELTDRIFGYAVTTYVLSEEFKDKKPFILPNFDENSEKKEEI